MRVGDALFLFDHANAAKDQGFIIEKISAYRHKLDEISEGMTCELMILGEVPGLKEDHILYAEG